MNCCRKNNKQNCKLRQIFNNFLIIAQNKFQLYNKYIFFELFLNKISKKKLFIIRIILMIFHKITK